MASYYLIPLVLQGSEYQIKYPPNTAAMMIDCSGADFAIMVAVDISPAREAEIRLNPDAVYLTSDLTGPPDNISAIRSFLTAFGFPDEWITGSMTAGDILQGIAQRCYIYQAYHGAYRENLRQLPLVDPVNSQAKSGQLISLIARFKIQMVDPSLSLRDWLSGVAVQLMAPFNKGS